MSLNTVAHKSRFRRQPRGNEFVDSGFRLIIFEFATVLRCFATRCADIRSALACCAHKRPHNGRNRTL
jgi:hypothetical protein